MKKSSFVALILGTVSGVLFALGMCMALLPEWNAFNEGIVFGAIGIVLGIVTSLIWCKMENKKLPKMSGKNLFRTIYELEEMPRGNYTVSVNPREISKMTGQKKSNIEFFREKGYFLKIKGDEELKEYQIKITI